MDKLNVILDKVITYTDTNLLIGKITFAEQKPLCYPVMPSTKSAEEMLKKALEFANQESFPNCEFTRCMNCTKRQMAAHLEMLIMEARQNG